MIRQAIYTVEDSLPLIENGREWNFHDEDTQEHLHTLHPYPAKFIPQIPRRAIRDWSNVADVVYDPFCGCGTTLLESSLLGRPSIGTDNNAVAVLVSNAKLARYTTVDRMRLDEFLQLLETRLISASVRKDLIPTSKNFQYWFSWSVLEEMSRLMGLIEGEPEPVRTLLLAAFSAIVVKVSYQDSDTRYSRQNKDVAPVTVKRAFQAKLRAILDSLSELGDRDRASAEVRQADARVVPFIEDDSVELIVTSPPYLNAYDYHKYHRQRLHWIGGDVAFARDQEIGGHDQFTRPKAVPQPYFHDMGMCFKEWFRVLKHRGRCLIVVGDAIVSKTPVAVADAFVDIGKRHGFLLKERWIRELMSTKRSFNVRNSRITHEHVLLFDVSK